jgi:1-acyl-sn-glycerol-3-phosphate acyltransferase
MKKNEFLYQIMRPVFSGILALYYNPRIINRNYIPRYGAAVVAGNHKHALDPLLVGASTVRVLHSLAKKELHDGAFGWLFRAAGTIPVDLHARENRQALASAVEYLRAGALIGVSPESKRNYTSEVLLPFKFGAVSMAQKTGCPIIPYAITGEYRFRSRDLTIEFGPPLDVSGQSVSQANQLLYDTIKDMLIRRKEESKRGPR